MGAIVGRVTSPDGKPVPDAAVAIAGDSPPHPDIAALTGGDGGFRLLGLTAGQYTLQVNAAGRPAQARSVRVEESGFAEIEFQV